MKRDETGAVIGSVVEHDDATAFERWALEGLVPLQGARPHPAVKDIENNAVRVMAGTAVVRVYAGGVKEVHVDLRPLAFGAAWKVLDLLIELALSQAGMATGTVTITEKLKQARKAAGQCLPLTGDTVLWRGLAATYAGTEEIRHSLVHRRAEVDRASGELTGRDRQGRPLTPISAAHQEAFCRAVQRAATAALNRSISPRERSDLAWNLDQLTHVHGLDAIGGIKMAPAPLGVVRARMRNGTVLVEAPSILTEFRANFPDRAAYDASFELQDGRHLLVELEQAPHEEVAVDPAALPPWAVMWPGPG